MSPLQNQSIIVIRDCTSLYNAYEQLQRLCCFCWILARNYLHALSDGLVVSPGFFIKQPRWLMTERIISSGQKSGTHLRRVQATIDC